MRTLTLFALTLLATAAIAQTGPAAPKVLVVGTPMPLPVPVGNDKREYSAVIELQVSPEGRIAQSRVAKSSGDARFDLLLGKYFRRWRVVPAIDASGNPTAGVLRIAYRKAVNAQARVDALAAENAKPGAEASRVERMSCRDFVWEYDLMQSIAGKHSVDNEELLRTAFGLYLGKNPTKKSADLDRLMWARRPAIADSLEACRTTPSKQFWSEVYQPTLARHFKKGSRPAKQWPPPKKRKTS